MILLSITIGGYNYSVEERTNISAARQMKSAWMVYTWIVYFTKEMIPARNATDAQARDPPGE
jgi:hypothetical protein